MYYSNKLNLSFIWVVNKKKIKKCGSVCWKGIIFYFILFYLLLGSLFVNKAGQCCCLVILELQVWAQVVSGNKSGIKQLPNLLFTFCGYPCKREQLKKWETHTQTKKLNTSVNESSWSTLVCLCTENQLV